MNQTKQWMMIGATALAAIALGAASYFFLASRTEQPTLSGGQTEERAASSSTPTAERGIPQGEGLPVSSAGLPENMPPLDRPITFSAVFSEEARALMRAKFAASIAALRKDPGNFDEWMSLAILRKTVDDYEGAAEIWVFLTRMNPEQSGPYANLAALYTYELKNPVLAEQNFTEAIRKGPKAVSVYRNAYDFYRYVQKDDAKAKQVLEDGIKQTHSSDLQYLLDHYSEI